MKEKEQIHQVSHSTYIRMLNNSIRWQKLIKLCGYLGDSSQERIVIYQDDATGTAHISVGRKTYSGESIEFVFDGISTTED